MINMHKETHNIIKMQRCHPKHSDSHRVRCQRWMEGERGRAGVMQRRGRSDSSQCQQQSGQNVAKTGQQKLERNYHDTNTRR